MTATDQTTPERVGWLGRIVAGMTNRGYVHESEVSTAPLVIVFRPPLSCVIRSAARSLGITFASLVRQCVVQEVRQNIDFGVMSKWGKEPDYTDCQELHDHDEE